MVIGLSGYSAEAAAQKNRPAASGEKESFHQGSRRSGRRFILRSRRLGPQPQKPRRRRGRLAQVRSNEHARDVQRLAPRAVGDLVAAARAVGDDDARRARCASPAAGSPRPSHRDRRSGSPRSRSCRPCRSTRSRSASGSAPGIRRSTSRIGATAPNAFWWQWPCTRIGASTGLKASAKRPAFASRAMNSSNSSACAATVAALSPRPITSASSRSVSRHDGSRPTMAMPALGERQQRVDQRAGRGRAPRRPCRWRGRCGRSSGGRRPCRACAACSRRPSARAPRRARSRSRRRR